MDVVMLLISLPVLILQSVTFTSLLRVMWMPSVLGLVPGAVIDKRARCALVQSSTDTWICWLFTIFRSSTLKFVQKWNDKAVGASLHGCTKKKVELFQI